jgi:hypothetical protein
MTAASSSSMAASGKVSVGDPVSTSTGCSVAVPGVSGKSSGTASMRNTWVSSGASSRRSAMRSKRLRSANSTVAPESCRP